MIGEGKFYWKIDEISLGKNMNKATLTPPLLEGSLQESIFLSE